MAPKRGVRRKRIKPRNPLVPVVRTKRAAVIPSKRAYTRKRKHKSGDDPDPLPDV